MIKLSSDSSYLKAAWIWILGWTLFRMIFSAFFPLSPDETNYWQWGRHLAWGYHDQAPLIGWAIRLCTSLFGNNEFAVRLPSVLSMGIASAYMVLMAKRFFSPKTAFAVALLSQGILEFNIGGLLATADGLQACAWAAASYHGASAYEDGSWKHWLLTGFFFGMGMLSKFTMVIFAPGILVYGLISPVHRMRLASPRPYIGFLLGIAIFSPVLIWNAANGWNSARHVAHIGGAGQSTLIQLKYFGDFLGSQAGVLSPLVFILVLIAWLRVLMRRYEKNWFVPYALWTSLPMFAGFTSLSLHSRVYGNWPGAAYITASVLTAAFFSKWGSDNTKKRQGLFKWALITSYALTVFVLIQTVFPLLPVKVNIFEKDVDIDRMATELGGFEELGREASEMLKKMPEGSFLFGIRYQEASELAFYAPGQPETVSINKWRRPNVYDYWWNDEDLLGKDAIGITRYPKDHEHMLNTVFEKVLPPKELKIYRKRPFSSEPEYVKTYYLYPCYGFKGGLRWMPKDISDIRNIK